LPTATLTPTPTPTPQPSVFASDTFTRSSAGEWGDAETGSLYSYTGRQSDFSVGAGTGSLALPAGATRSVFLLSTLATDVDMTFSTSLDKPATGGGIWIYGTVRRTTDGSAYRPKIRIDASGAVYAVISKIVGSTETPLGAAVQVAGLVAVPNVPIHVRARAWGASPTTLQIRAWSDLGIEPVTWSFTATDSTASLQTAGSIGLLAYATSNITNGPISVRFDDLRATSDDPARLAGPVLVGAGDIASCAGQADEATARLLGLIGGSVFTAGDNAYQNGSAVEYANCFDPSWGAYKSITHPTVGNHEYNTANAQPYFDYFGTSAGAAGKGYYVFSTGTWRVYVLNSNCGIVSCAAGSVQEQWLKADLAANPSMCTMAIMHHPRYSSGSEHGSTLSVQPLWQDLYDAGAEIVVSGHDHDYERFAPQNASGTLDANGVREFVIGTGGASLRALKSVTVANSEIRQATAYGVLRLTLGAAAYEWEFVPIAGQTFTDRGSGTCH
jgi:hypothetical protein